MLSRIKRIISNKRTGVAGLLAWAFVGVTAARLKGEEISGITDFLGCFLYGGFITFFVAGVSAGISQVILGHKAENYETRDDEVFFTIFITLIVGCFAILMILV